MGNMKFPRPKDINFPEIQNKMEFNYEKMAERRGREKMFGHSICPLKSGNILISYMWKDEITSELKVCLGIYSIPKLKLIQEYIFHNENDNEVYDVDIMEIYLLYVINYIYLTENQYLKVQRLHQKK